MGGLGSMLIAQGLEAGQAPERWNLEYPDRIAAATRLDPTSEDCEHLAWVTQSCKNLAAQSTALSRLRFPPKSPRS